MRYDSRAYLQSIRNIDRGLRSRDSILKQLNNEAWLTITDISAEIHLSHATIRYHLQNLESEGFIERNPEGRGWKLSVFPQGKLSDYIKLRRPRPRKKKTG